MSLQIAIHGTYIVTRNAIGQSWGIYLCHVWQWRVLDYNSCQMNVFTTNAIGLDSKSKDIGVIGVGLCGMYNVSGI